MTANTVANTYTYTDGGGSLVFAPMGVAASTTGMVLALETELGRAKEFKTHLYDLEELFYTMFFVASVDEVYNIGAQTVTVAKIMSRVTDSLGHNFISAKDRLFAI
jgi:hypothetical protein